MIVLSGLILLNNFENNVDVWTGPFTKLAELDIDGKILTCALKSRATITVGCHFRQISIFSHTDINLGGKIKPLKHI
jgi:hypothetical protein